MGTPADAVLVRLILGGLGVTIMTTALIIPVALLTAFLGAFGRLSPRLAVRLIARVYIEFFRGTSAFVQLFWAYFVLPQFGFVLSPIQVGVAVLGLNAGAYGSEIVKGAILAVPKGQWEAAIALNLSPLQRMWRIILPQAVPTMIPSFGNVMVDVLKGTALLSLITVVDVTRAVRQLISGGGLPYGGGYALLLVIYFLLSLPLVYLTRRAERRSRRHLPTVAAGG